MAKKELAFEASVDIANGAKSIKSLRNEYKEAQSELNGLTVGTKEYIKQLEKLGNIKDQIGDLNDEIAAFNPQGKVQAFGNVVGGLASGFQAAQGAAALFGAEGEALQKTLLKVQAASAFADGIKGIAGLKDAFVVLGNVIKANPIMLIASVIIGIGTALFALKDKIKPVADAFAFLGDVIDTVVQGAKDFLDYIGLTNFALDEQRESIITNNEAIKKSVEGRYDAEIQAAKRAGKETEALEIQKLKAITEANEAIIRTLKAKGKERSDEENKQLDELLAQNRKYFQDILNLADAAADKRRADDAKELEEYKKKLEEKRKADEAARIEALKSQEAARVAAEQARISIDEANKAEEDLKQQEEWARMDADTQKYLEEIEKRKQADAEKAAQERAFIDEGLTASANAAQSLQALSDAVFAIKMGNLEKGSKAELELAKKQFRINKALAITQATISTIQGVVNALTAQSALPEPYAMILRVITAASVGIAGAANIAKISSQQFNPNGGGGGGVSAANISSAGSGANIAPPSTGSTLLNPDGTIKRSPKPESPMVKAVVTETDITGTQKRVNSIEEKSQIK